MAQLLPPLLAAFYWPRANGAAVLTWFVAGIVVNTAFLLFPEYRPLPLHEGVYGLGANAVLLVALTLLNRRNREAALGGRAG